MPSRPRVARRRRGEDFFANYERVLDVARSGAVDVVVHGGDLLYRGRVPLWLAEQALAPLRELASSGIPVLLIPGNHERSAVPYPLLAVHEHLHVFDRPRTVTIAAGGVRAAFVGFPYTHDIRRRFPAILAEASREAVDADVRVLCIHQCVDGATCGPGTFTFRGGDDVIRVADLPDVAVTLSGHIHRHQVLRPAGRAQVVYAGSTERTSFAEARETKGFVVLELTPCGLGSLAFHALPARPWFRCTLGLDGLDAAQVHARVAAAIAATPGDAVVQLRIGNAVAPLPNAAALREMSGTRTVTLSLPYRATRAAGQP
jgi:DNA repair exonuclease SbcCD nuclease subunit